MLRLSIKPLTATWLNINSKSLTSPTESCIAFHIPPNYSIAIGVQISDETVWDFEFGSVSVFFCPKNLGIGIEIGIGTKSV
jgi:hypothetical protein